MTGMGVRIAQALIEEPLDLEFAVVSWPVELRDGQFLAPVTFNLGIAKNWKYEEMPPIIALYVCCQRFSGYVLISIALAALISSFK